MRAVAEEMHAAWNGSPGVHFIPEFYDVMGLRTWLSDHGIEEEPEGIHDEFAMAAMMAAVDPNSIRSAERRQAGLFQINGVDLDPLDETIAWGLRLFRHRSEVTVAAIQKAIAAATAATN